MEPTIKWKGIKILEVRDEYLIGVKKYRLYKYDLKTAKWSRYAKVNDPSFMHKLFRSTWLTTRMTRTEVNKWYLLQDGSELCIARKGIFRKPKDSDTFIKTYDVPRGSRPMNLCEANDGTVLLGEYFQNLEKKSVNVYRSTDHGQTWAICYTFPEGNINHIHGLFKDPYTGRIWIATGDRENECILGYSEDNFDTITEVLRGGQDYRSCIMFFYQDYIIYATDSQYQRNKIKKIDRKTLEVTDLQEVQGPVIRGSQSGNFAFISTDVEESEVNLDKNAYVWYTRDGLNWKELCHAEKDCLHEIYFQYAVFDLPTYNMTKDISTVYVTGKAMKKADNITWGFDVKGL